MSQADLFGATDWLPAFSARYQRGQRAQGRMNGVLRAGKVLDGKFLSWAPGPVEVDVESVRDLKLLEES